VILCPIRELAIQIQETFQKIIQNLENVDKKVSVGVLIGGEDLKKEKSDLRRGVNFLIATPGKMIYHLKNTESLKFDNLQVIVFEESDRTLDLGFQKELETIIQIMNQKNVSL
jgi:ATP-dependent RNA helicase DDX31/DBP7